MGDHTIAFLSLSHTHTSTRPPTRSHTPTNSTWQLNIIGIRRAAPAGRVDAASSVPDGRHRTRALDEQFPLNSSARAVLYLHPSSVTRMQSAAVFQCGLVCLHRGRSFTISNNNVTGDVPSSLTRRFGVASFAWNCLNDVVYARQSWCLASLSPTVSPSGTLVVLCFSTCSHNQSS